jgi:hypothetical protein
MATPTTYAYVSVPGPSLIENIAGLTTVPLSSVRDSGSNTLTVQFADVLSITDKQNLDDFLAGYGYAPTPSIAPEGVFGTGDPNGVVVGSPGDSYFNKNGGANATLWVKESGVGTDTGWVAK